MCGESPVVAAAAALREQHVVNAAGKALHPAHKTDLRDFRHTLKDLETLPKGKFTEVRKLATGINGDVFLCRCAHAGGLLQSVAVKKLQRTQCELLDHTETNERSAHFGLSERTAPAEEDVLKEMGVLRYLAVQADLPLYLLRMQGLFLEGSSEAWLVTELAEGGELLAKVQLCGALPPVQARAFVWQALQAVAYLHRHQIGHRDISLENLLLKSGGVRLMDFGMSVRSATATTTLRYFRPAGKDFYRAPECYVPTTPEVVVVAPADAAPGDVVSACVDGAVLCDVRLPVDAVPETPCRAEVWGCAVPPADVWSVAVCAFIMLTGIPAWNRAVLCDPNFALARERGLSHLLQQWRLPALPAAAQELIDCTMEAEPSRRPTASECLRLAWFGPMQHAPVPVHPKDDMVESLHTGAVGGA